MQFAGTYLRECPRNKVLWIWVFFFFLFCFLFYRKVSEFFKALFQRIHGWIFFRLNFSSSWIFLVELQQSTFIYFYFFGSFIQEASDGTTLLANFSCLYLSVPEFVLRVRLVVQRRKSLFGAALSEITPPFSTPAKSSATRSQLDFFLEIIFYK